jgi:toxin YoeB
MIYRINILSNAKKDLDWMRKNDRVSYLKAFDLIREMMEDPRHGTGKPERLKYFNKEVYSRRINQKDRLIYTIYESAKEIDITSARGHYS